MTTASREAADYFMSQERHFWRWADNGDVIEWQNGVTICYRAELVQLLNQLEGHVVPLSQVLLFLAACNESYKNSRCNEVLHDVILQCGWLNERKGENFYKQGVCFMEAVSGLPKEIKNSIPKKAHILYEVFQPQATPSNLTWSQLADELKSGRLDLTKETNRITFQPGVFKQELGFLSTAGLNYPNTARLALKVMTGMPEVPEPLPVAIPEPENPDLLGQLATDPQTSGISYLTKHLIAALNIPMHSQGAGDQPLGGISDITNKGSYDRLLLSELAQDEELLTARLVNNEALYYRREEPPDNVNRKRVLLLDTTIKMWGTPRAFGLSAALACSLNTRHGEAIEAYSLADGAYAPIDITTAHGVVEALQLLNPGLHCAKALQNLISDQDKTENDEYILITGDWQHQPYDFQSVFSVIKASLNFIISVDRSGDLHLYECINGNAKLIGTSKFDLDELLFGDHTRKVPKQRQPKSEDIDPEVMKKLNRVNIIPPIDGKLYLPTLVLRAKNLAKIYGEDWGLVCLTDDRRLVFWQSPYLGALELISLDAFGKIYLGWYEDNFIYVLVNNQQDFVLFEITLFPYSVTRKKQFQITDSWYVTYTYGAFVVSTRVQYKYKYHKLNCVDLTITEFDNYPAANPPEGYNRISHLKIDRTFKKIINPGYTVYISIGKVEVVNYRNAFHIVFGNKILFMPEKQKNQPERNLFIREINSSFTPFIKPTFKSTAEHKFADGSYIIIDKRGWARLVSSDKNIPEITILMVLDMPTACYASDGAICGWEYFTGPNRANKVDTTLFYNKYIQPFINRIVSAAKS